MDLRTEYLGLKLAAPLMPGASPLVDDLDIGAPAGGRRRRRDRHALALRGADRRASSCAVHRHVEAHDESFAEALTYLPGPTEFALGPDEYLEQIRTHQAPPSTSRSSPRSTAPPPAAGSSYAKLIEQAGADALELNVYDLRDRLRRGAARRSSSARSTSCAAVQARGQHPRRGEALAVLLLAAALRPRAGAGGRGRPGALQPLLPAGHRRREPGGGAHAAPVRLLRAAAAPALARHPRAGSARSRWR